MSEHPKMNDLANEFAATFSLFEYALKSCGCWTFDNGRVGTSWPKFIHAYPEVYTLIDDLRGNDVTSYIIQKPPMKRTIVDGALDWKTPSEVRTMDDLWDAVKRVRNNLFHGDKTYWDVSRDPDLLRAALAVIDALLSAAPAVKDQFERGVELFCAR